MASTACARSEEEVVFINAVNSGDEDTVKRLITSPTLTLDCQDEFGATPLQNAAFRGNAKVCEILLEHGSPVDSDFHKNKYSTLTFAALSGNPDVTRLILEAGADIDRKNSMGKTAAEMASFTQQHHCVALINNFFPRGELSRVLTEEVSLPSELTEDVLGLLRMSNIHPVKVAKYLQDHPKLLENSEVVCKVLKALLNMYMKENSQKYDIRILKIHYLAFVFEKASASYKDHKGSLNSLVKSLVKGRDEDGFQETAERFVRQCLKEFPHTELALFGTIIMKVSKVKVGSHPSAIDIISAELAGRHQSGASCDTCGEQGHMMSCSVCKKAVYCNKDCQKLHWSTHKKFCKTLAAQAATGSVQEDLTSEVIRQMQAAGLAKP